MGDRPRGRRAPRTRPSPSPDCAPKRSRVSSVIAQPVNRGLGGTLRAGFAAARLEWILYSDCDLPWDLAETGRLFRAAEITGADLVSAYRLDRTGEGFLRSLYSFGYNGLVQVLFGIVLRDVNFSCKLIRRSLLSGMPLKSEGSFIDAELLARCVARGAVDPAAGRRLLPADARPLDPLLAADDLHDPVGDGALRARDPRRAAPPRNALTRVVLNADDFGLAPAHTRRVAALRAQGLLTDVSLLANGTSFDAAASWPRARRASPRRASTSASRAASGRSLGPREIPSLLSGGAFRRHWSGVLLALTAGRIRTAEVEREWEAQIARVEGAGLRVTHLDSHQNLHLHPPALPRRRDARAADSACPSCGPRAPTTRPDRPDAPPLSAPSRAPSRAARGPRPEAPRRGRPARASARPRAGRGGAHDGRSPRERAVGRPSRGRLRGRAPRRGRGRRDARALPWGYDWRGEAGALESGAVAAALAARGIATVGFGALTDRAARPRGARPTRSRIPATTSRPAPDRRASSPRAARAREPPPTSRPDDRRARRTRRAAAIPARPSTTSTGPRASRSSRATAPARDRRSRAAARRSDSFSRRRRTPVSRDVPAGEGDERGERERGVGRRVHVDRDRKERRRAARRTRNRQRLLAGGRDSQRERPACGRRPRAEHRIRLSGVAREAAQRHASAGDERSRDRKARRRVVARHAEARGPVTAARRRAEAVEDAARQRRDTRPRQTVPRRRARCPPAREARRA